MDAENNNTTMIHEKETQLRNLLNRVELIEQSEDTGLQAVKDVNSILQELNLLERQCPLSNRVENAEESLLDAMLVNTASGLVLKFVDAVDLCTTVYEGTEFVGKIKSSLKNPESEEFEDKDILKLSVFAQDIISDVPQFTPLFVSNDTINVIKEKAPRAKKSKQAQEKVVKKKLIKVVDMEEEDSSIEKIVSILLNVLQEEFDKQKKPIDYFEYVMDTGDFAQTVQNIFYTSFLVKDGKAKLDIDSEGNPTLQPMSKHDFRAFKKAEASNTQIITSIDMEMWESTTINSGYLQRYKEKQQS